MFSRFVSKFHNPEIKMHNKNKAPDNPPLTISNFPHKQSTFNFDELESLSKVLTYDMSALVHYLHEQERKNKP